jgi:hypothetical protein
MHVGKNGLKPSLFSHAEQIGCSVQRESMANDNEIIDFVRSLLDRKASAAWFGVVTATCADIRALIAPGNNPDRVRAVCVYDTAEPNNRAHAEICRARDYFDESDTLELRHDLLALFQNGPMTARDLYRAGAIWNALRPGLRQRPV